MNNSHFSFIILTLNEEQHLPRLLQSIKTLKANIYVLDSGSTDQTLDICYKYKIQVSHHPFQNHPKQWDAALRSFNIQTPWVIGLDADHIVSPELCEMLKNFKNEDHLGINGIYFNRKNYFKGKWIRFGGYYPKYLLKMFRYQIGYSDLQENMDHRFQVPSKTVIWKRGHLIEENLKENRISFWLDKHNRYSDLVAEEEIQRLMNLRLQTTKPSFWGSPNEHNAWLKRLWWQLPRYFRPFLYFIYRMIFRLGILDGKTGIIFHFLQGFWFRLIIDIKIDEKLDKPNRKSRNFVLSFLTMFFLLYSFNLIYIGLTTPGHYYSPTLDKHFNYINSWRDFSISSTAYLLKILGYQVTTTKNHLINHGFSGFRLVYSCLGYGIMSCFSAFVLAFPRPLKSKIIFLAIGLSGIQLLNILRFALISIYYKPQTVMHIDHHDLFNYSIYLILGSSVYLWIRSISKKN